MSIFSQINLALSRASGLALHFEETRGMRKTTNQTPKETNFTQNSLVLEQMIYYLFLDKNTLGADFPSGRFT